jgi:hypothetical protein
MPEPTNNAMDALANAAAQVLEIHDPGEAGRCTQADCLTRGLAGRCLPHRIADEVISTWANRIHLPTARPWRTAAPPTNPSPRRGRTVVLPSGAKSIQYPPGTFPVGTDTVHPAWCVGLSCREPDGDRTHIGTPDRVANLLVTLMHMEGEPPVVTVSDLTHATTKTTTIVVPVEFAASLAQAVRLTGLRAATGD